jgi:hypothetical protein
MPPFGFGSRALMILVIISSFPLLSILQLSPKAVAQVNSSEGAKVLVDDAIQALKSNDTNRAQIHLNILNQQLPTFVNARSFESIKVLLDDAVSALNSGDLNKAVVHLNLIKQQFTNSTNNDNNNTLLNMKLNEVVDFCIRSLPNGTSVCDNRLSPTANEICAEDSAKQSIDACNNGKVAQYYKARNIDIHKSK